MKTLADLKIKFYADGADRADMLVMLGNPLIKGFTTNPTLMRRAGISDYQAFALDILSVIKTHPVSFEVFADDVDEMKRQALFISGWGENVYVKIPVTNTRGEWMTDLMHDLSQRGVKINATALMTLAQVRSVSAALAGGAACNISLFAGRIADSGRDPVPMVAKAVKVLSSHPNQELIWASPREVLNIFQAEAAGCHIITLTQDVLKKLTLIGKDLDEFSLETVKMFWEDAQKAGYKL